MTGPKASLLTDLGEEFVVRGSFFGKTFYFNDGAGNQLLYGKRNHQRDQDRMLYYDNRDSIVYRYTGADWGRPSVAFTLVEEASGDTVAVLERVDEDDQYRWSVKPDPDSDPEAVVEKGPSNGILDPRGWDIPILSPMTMTITSPSGGKLGVISGRSFASRITFDVKITRISDEAKAGLLLAAILLYEAMGLKTYGGG